MKKFKITYSNNGDKCTLSKNVVNLFAESKAEAKQLCSDLYETTENFKIYSAEVAA